MAACEGASRDLRLNFFSMFLIVLFWVYFRPPFAPDIIHCQWVATENKNTDEGC
jgi:hypothetical protein